MMFGGIEHLVESGPLLLAMPVAAAAGAVTFLSPCVLPLVPGYLSYLTGMSGIRQQAAAPAAAAVPVAAGSAAGPGPAPSPAGPAPAAPAAAPAGRAVLGTLLFVLGFSFVMATEGLFFGALGDGLQEHKQGLSQILGAVIILLGLLFVGAFDRFTVTGRIFRPKYRPRAGLAGAPLLGVVFGLGWTPCIGPTLAAVLTLGATTGTAGRGALLAFIYALGLGIPFLIVAAAFQRGLNLLGWARRHARRITQIGGLLLIVVGVLEVTGAWYSAITWLQVHWLAGYNTPI
ncbi:MAG TPA: cytochrome c biogenesis protein CcdA [Streptosporangiaceae bacterium]|nr:cytochrome c biogenesis protein CcdA [Streptosporangiaceae bacterium]